MPPDLQGLPATGRRGFMGWMGRIGVAVVGAAAGATATQQAAHANYACCSLALPNTPCSGNGGSFRCPSGYKKYSWTCCRSSALYGCGECTTGSNCWQGSFACSKGWVIANPTGCGN